VSREKFECFLFFFSNSRIGQEELREVGAATGETLQALLSYCSALGVVGRKTFHRTFPNGVYRVFTQGLVDPPLVKMRAFVNR